MINENLSPPSQNLAQGSILLEEVGKKKFKPTPIHTQAPTSLKKISKIALPVPPFPPPSPIHAQKPTMLENKFKHPPPHFKEPTME